MAAKTTIELERVRYWQGQLLASGDLQTQLAVDEELRRLHNRAVHQAYGIAIGLMATLEDGKLTLTCGMAYDCAGRGLIVEADTTIPLPAQAIDTMTLVLSYDPTSVHGIALKWKLARDVNANIEVPITRLRLNSAPVPKPEIDPTFRAVVARPLARPRLATGTTIPGETAWKPWKISEEEIGVKVLIDTSAAGFTRTPHYFAEAVAGKLTADFVPAWFASIADPSTQGFTLQLMLRRITRESLDIADPKGQVVDTLRVADGDELKVTLKNSNPFLIEDFVARLLPIAEQASVINKLVRGVATLDDQLEDLSEKTEVAFGNAPRTAQVIKPSDQATMVLTVDSPDLYKAGNVVLSLVGPLANVRPVKIVAIDEDDTIELSMAITGLSETTKLRIVKEPTNVQAISADQPEIDVPKLADFKEDDVVVRVQDMVESSAPAKINFIKSSTNPANKTLVLSASITHLAQNDSIGRVREDEICGVVESIADNTGKASIKVDNAETFRKGDLVALISPDGLFSPPVRVEGITPSTKTLTLSGNIPGLIKDDIIGAADFRVRATVSGLTNTTISVADATLFPQDFFIAKIDELLSASLPEKVTNSSGQTLTLARTIQGLKVGDVIGLCAFPVTVKVQEEVQGDRRTVVVNNGALLRKYEKDIPLVVTALPKHKGLALVASITGNEVRLAEAIPDLKKGDSLSVATIRGVIDVTPHTSATISTPQKVTVDQPASAKRVQVGDFLAYIKGWLQPRLDNSSSAFVNQVNSTQITLAHSLDGLLKNDSIGLTSIISRNYLSFFQIRLKTTATLRSGDEALVVGLDRLLGQTQSMSAWLWPISDSQKRVWLLPEEAPGPFTFRPADLSVAVLFVHGSALALIQKNDLFVSWLAIGEPDKMPKKCAGTEVPDCTCSQAKE